MPNARAVAIDPGIMTGWATCAGDCGEWPAGGDGDFAAGIVHVQQQLADLMAEYRPAIVIIERPFFGRHRNADVTGALLWAAHSAAWFYDARRLEISAQQVRRHHWRAHKPSDRERVAMAAALGWPALTDHAADAALMLAWWQASMQKEAA